MPRFAYVNGRFVPHMNAAVHIEDRGYQFADGVYEVVTVVDGAMVDDVAHLERLARSLGELKIEPPCGERALKLIMRELIRRNLVRDGSIYLQITRGVAPRDFKFPKTAKSTLVMTTRRRSPSPQKIEDMGVAVVTMPDLRWARRDIKTIGLLAQVLAKQAAAEAGAFEAWLIDGEGRVNEGASSNAWIVTKDGVLVTHPANHAILKGVTGNSLRQLAAEIGVTVEDRGFTVAEALASPEAFLTSATTICLPIVSIDGKPVGDGRPGRMVRRLHALYLDYAHARRSAPFHWRA